MIPKTAVVTSREFGDESATRARCSFKGEGDFPLYRFSQGFEALYFGGQPSRMGDNHHQAAHMRAVVTKTG